VSTPGGPGAPPPAGTAAARPAFYALRPGGWRDYATLLHAPYTAWHLAYVVVGGCLAPAVAWGRLGLAIAAFALAMGVGAHALDELNGRPLGTAIPARVLAALAVASLAAACALGIVVAVSFSLWLLAFVAAGAFLVPAYNLELFGGRVHTDLWFGLAWGAFPLLTGYFACAGELRGEAVLAAGWATLLSLAQRRLSTPVRRLRRRVAAVHGELELSDGSREPLSRELLLAAPERALRLLAAATVAVAAALVVLRV
jgi:hypothetical protein